MIHYIFVTAGYLEETLVDVILQSKILEFWPLKASTLLILAYLNINEAVHRLFVCLGGQYFGKRQVKISKLKS